MELFLTVTIFVAVLILIRHDRQQRAKPALPELFEEPSIILRGRADSDHRRLPCVQEEQ